MEVYRSQSSCLCSRGREGREMEEEIRSGLIWFIWFYAVYNSSFDHQYPPGHGTDTCKDEHSVPASTYTTAACSTLPSPKHPGHRVPGALRKAVRSSSCLTWAQLLKQGQLRALIFWELVLSATHMLVELLWCGGFCGINSIFMYVVTSWISLGLFLQFGTDLKSNIQLLY